MPMQQASVNALFQPFGEADCERFAGDPRGPCPHYQSNCRVVGACCNVAYGCKQCHNKGEGHPLDPSHSMACALCGKIQAPSGACVSCREPMAEYFCGKCAVWASGPAFHCDECGVCRRGEAAKFFHCRGCNACMDRRHRDELVHLENALGGNCSICVESLRSSREPSIAPSCGHAIHRDCFLYYTKTNHCCPVCFSLLGDLTEFNAKIDLLLASSADLNEGRGGRDCLITCYACRRRYVVGYTFMFHKCPSCKTFNTRPAHT